MIKYSSIYFEFNRKRGYLKNGLPLSFLLEQESLRNYQFEFLVEKASMHATLYSSSLTKPEDYFVIPDDMKNSPLLKEDELELLKRLKKLKKAGSELNTDNINLLESELSQCENLLQSFNMNEIALCEILLQNMSMIKNGNEIAAILEKHHITSQEFSRLNEVYTKYLQTKKYHSKLLEFIKENAKPTEKINREIEDIKTALVVQNVETVNLCANYFFNGLGLPQDELKLYAMEVLANAIDNFNTKSKIQFSTYAVLVIINTIKLNFKDITGLNWSDFYLKKQISYSRDMYRQQACDDIMDVSAEALINSRLTTLTKRTIKSKDELIDRVLPFSDVIPEAEDSSLYGNSQFPITFEEYNRIDKYIDSIEVGFNNTELLFLQRYLREKLLNLVNLLLDPREAQILILKYGLEDGQMRTCEEVAKLFNLTYQRIQKIIAHDLRKLRHRIEVKKLKDLLEYFDELKGPTTLDELPPKKTYTNLK